MRRRAILMRLLKNLENLTTNRYLEDLWKVVTLANAAVAKYEPWSLVKAGKSDEANALVALCANLLAKVAILLSPAMPKTCAKIADTLGFSIDTASYETLVLKNEISNFMAKATEPLFPRIEKELMGEASKPKEEAKVEAKAAAERGEKRRRYH